ncbi:Proton-coupled amino acid transporter 1 [Thelohanellus kitauei]|uniref:Proton-coupled amino acid transporter 1 n=1 Tax=Thelohanellus kitauei TaxID=669202 RepID=A0A0C2MX37_THEKT|nr:Proton-coupled amino acid transporter 1 [Thelohanellus kitauei]
MLEDKNSGESIKVNEVTRLFIGMSLVLIWKKFRKRIFEVRLFSAAVNIFKGSIGTGILGLPYSVKNCGILIGTICLALLGIVTIYCMNLIIICSRYLRRKYNLELCDYGDVAEYSVKQYGSQASYASRFITDIFIIFTQVGFLCVYVVFISATADRYLPERYHLIIVGAIFVALVIITSTTNLVIIGYMSTAASILQCSALGLLFIYLIAHFNGGENLKLIGDYRTLPLFFGTAMFAFEGIAVVSFFLIKLLPVENATKNREGFFLVLDISMGLVCVLYITSGFLGYAAFGEEVRGSVTLNLPHNL